MFDGDECRLAALGQAYVASCEIDVNLPAQRGDGLPLRVVVGPGDARVFTDTRDGHAEIELCFAGIDAAAYRRGAARRRRAGEGDVAFAGEQA